MKYKILKDCMDGKAGEVVEVNPIMAGFLEAKGYIEEVKAEPKKKNND